MKPLVYIDTNVFLARMDKKHKHHATAARFLKAIHQEGTGVVSTYTIFELIWVLVYLDKAPFIPIVLDKVFKTNVKVVPVNEEMLRQYRNTFEPIRDVKDFLHFTVMKSQGIDTIATFNPGHFTHYHVTIHQFT